ncbi:MULTISPECIES: MerR family transcriptional regulator [Pseudomonas]|jgi:DNA-binding transcriptional MerR regulator|uniref:MerR family transcriptional regulator n=1 Tax=Pseudomonas TaxID=286 RepID=UPI0001FB9553|nr:MULTISPECIES: MerR family transcriptional regulator [Pseudomonas]EGB98371.1 MerR family transcriptional regulator [Pseudomonas sp. TJI-51]MBA6123292.1 MerR family transcriptional regulator [Pseudomonas juntendi]MBH3372685.1 MerR family transcriptional regulator [Pseudomonas juntendi]MBI6915712.1 MerR family transcriptional regulator [Pseudomonas juntendi]MBS6039850.1 MerR family transcriptional regulator [Pseudomonas sp.]
MNIGELERRSGVGRHALRYYEQLGLIVAQRQANNYRSYSEQAVADLNFVQTAQRGGFTLAEIGEILAARRGNTLDCVQGALLVSGKMAEIQAKIQTLQAAYEVLDSERAKLVASAVATGLTIPENISAGA